MSGPIGHTFMYNLIIVFIVIVFGFLAGTLSYYKAFKINNRIVSALEKFEGYNEGSREEINRVLKTLGYSLEKIECKPEHKTGDLKMHLIKESANASINPYKYCIYIDNNDPSKGSYYTFGVMTYMNLDLPFIDRINIPIFTKTNRIYKFTNKDLNNE